MTGELPCIGCKFNILEFGSYYCCNPHPQKYKKWMKIGKVLWMCKGEWKEEKTVSLVEPPRSGGERPGVIPNMEVKNLTSNKYSTR